MMRCTVHLYLPPGWELGEGGEVGPPALRALGDQVRERCHQAAQAVGALTARGWACQVGRYEVVAVKRCDRAAAMLDFLHAGLDPVAMGLEEVGGCGGAGAGG